MSAGSPRTVLYIVDGLGLSGKTRTLASLAVRLNPERFRPIVCVLSPDRSALYDDLATARIPVHEIRCRDGLDGRVIVGLIRLARSVRASVVHCYNPRPILYGGLAAKAIGIRATVGFLSAFSCHVPDRPYGFLPQPLSTLSRRNVIRNRISISLMRYVVTVSASLGQRFCDYNGIAADKLRVVPYAADLAAFAKVTAADVERVRGQWGFGPHHVVVGSVGRLVEQKDYPTQLKAFAIAVERAPSLRMVVAGGGPLASSVERIVRDLHLQDRIRLVGECTDVPRLLRSLDVFVLSSKFEPYGVALLEAKAAGVAIAATRVNEIPEIVTDGQTALLSPAEDSRRLADSLITLATDPTLRAQLGARARLDAERLHGLEAMVAAYENLYEAALTA